MFVDEMSGCSQILVKEAVIAVGVRMALERRPGVVYESPVRAMQISKRSRLSQSSSMLANTGVN